ncbi:MAG: hypothetical protein JEZ14_06635 [Marinilabiliaceae bacterium]|nr:hypothetical protein [Marinilabiliaceae bacterium]
MKTKVILTCFICLILISGCTVLSFYPLYTPNELIRDDRIIGKWKSDGLNFNSDSLIWEVSFNEKIWKKILNNPFDRGSKEIQNHFTYTLHLYSQSHPEERAEFHLHLVELDGKLYLDFYPENWNMSNGILAIHLMYVHTFARIEISDQLEIAWFSTEWLQEQFAKNRIRIKHENNGIYTLLTAQPKELQKFIIKYADEESKSSERMTFNLKKI